MTTAAPVRETCPDAGARGASLYLDLLKRCLTDIIHIDDPMSEMVFYRPIRPSERLQYSLLSPVLALLRALELQVVRPNRQRFFDVAKMSPDERRDCRASGRDWPSRAHTMVGLKRLDNLQFCVETVLQEQIPGDFLETGVWRGGASIFVKGCLVAHGDRTRRVWLADSFCGLPPPDDDRFPADRGWNFHKSTELAVSRSTVEANFQSYGLFDERIHFLEGWFKTTLPSAPVERLAVLRMDGDLYESTIQALETMYEKVSPGGFVIVDDFALPPCANAVHDFRRAHSIEERIVDIDGVGAYWRKVVQSDSRPGP
jgi:O-methyltransferase